MKSRLIKITTGALLVYLTFGLSASYAQDNNTLTWAGCGITKKAFMQELATGFKAKTGTEFVLEGGGATREGRR